MLRRIFGAFSRRRSRGTLRKRRSGAFVIDTGTELVVLVAGILLSAVFSVILDVGFHWSIDLIVFFTILLIIATVTLLVAGIGQLQELVETIATRVDYVEESFDESRPQDYQGEVYLALERVVTQAQERILVLATPVFDSKTVREHPSRRALLNGMLKAIRANAGKQSGFTHERILQFPAKDARKPMIQLVNEGILGRATYNHCRRALLLEQEERQNGHRVSVEILVKEADNRISPSLIFDQRWIAIASDGVTKSGEPYIRTFLILDDLPGAIVPAYEGNFKEYRRNARLLTLDDFTP